LSLEGRQLLFFFLNVFVKHVYDKIQVGNNKNQFQKETTGQFCYVHPEENFMKETFLHFLKQNRGILDASS